MVEARGTFTKILKIAPSKKEDKIKKNLEFFKKGSLESLASMNTGIQTQKVVPKGSLKKSLGVPLSKKNVQKLFFAVKKIKKR